MNNKKIITLLSLGLLLISPVFSQNYNEKIDITAPFQPSVNDANKLNVEPDNYNIKIDKTRPEYDFSSFKYSMFNLMPNSIALIPPANYDLQPRKHIFSATMGFGSNIEPLIDIDINSIDNKKAAGGFDIFHNSAWRQMENIPDNSFNNTKVGGYGIVNINKQRLEAKASYSRYGFHYYATDVSADNLDKILPETIEQKVNIIDAELSLFNTKQERTNYKASVKYSYFNNLSKFDEHSFSIPVKFNHSPQWTDNDLFDINFNADVNIIPDSSTDYLVKLNPTYNFSGGAFDFALGFNASVFSKNEAEEGIGIGVGISPVVEIKANIIPQTFNIHIGVNGDVARNTFQSLFKINQYILTPTYKLNNYAFIPKETNTKWNLHAGFDSKIGKSVNFSGEVEYKIIDNMPIFVSQYIVAISGENSFRQNNFLVKYADINQLTIKADFTIDTKSKFLFNLHGRYNINENRNIAKCEELYNMPAFELYADATYRLNEKFHLNMRSYVIGSRTDLNTIKMGIEEIIELKPYYDLDLSARYMLNEKFSVWASLNNILHFNNSNYLWYNYVTYPINIMAGVTISM